MSLMPLCWASMCVRSTSPPALLVLVPAGGALLCTHNDAELRELVEDFPNTGTPSWLLASVLCQRPFGHGSSARHC